jgi:uncharacterized protein YjbJ (UPF0337 family)
MTESGPKAGLSGIVEDLKGKGKEALGAVSDNDDLREEGRAQQRKAGAEREVAEYEAKADAKRAEAKTPEAEQRSVQDD